MKLSSRHIGIQFIILLLVMVAVLQSKGQVGPEPSVRVDTAKQKPIVVINADKTVGYEKGKKSILTGNVKLRQDSTVIYAERVNLFSETNSAQAYGSVIIQRTDTTNAFCEELDYDGNRKYATMTGDVILENGSQKLYSEKIEYDMLSNIAYYDSRALMTDGARFISSKKGRYYLDSSLVVFYDSVTVAGPGYLMKTDSLHFNTLTNIAYFVDPVRMKQGDKNIYCEAGYFNLNDNFALLRENAQFSSPTQEASADTILFYGQSEDISLIGNAWFKEATKEVTAKRIDYQKSKDKAVLIGDVNYQDEDQTAVGERMEYTLSSGAFKTEGRAEVIQGTQYLAAENMYDLPEGNVMRASGNVVWYDTAQQVSLYCQDALINKKNKSVKAFGKELLLISQLEGDSLFLTADTLLTSTIKNVDSTEYHELYAYHNVVAYKKNMQFVADSISFLESDSLFRIFGNPIIWSDTSRFFGDTIYIQLANDVIDKILIKNNAFIINKNATDFFNQIKGREIVAQFVNSQLDRTRVKGNAESIYYAVDEQKAYIGVNKIACSEMELNFVSNQIGTIRFYRQPTSSFFPMKEVDHIKLRLEGFSLDEEYRSQFPKDIFRVYQLMSKL